MKHQALIARMSRLTRLVIISVMLVYFAVLYRLLLHGPAMQQTERHFNLIPLKTISGQFTVTVMSLENRIIQIAGNSLVLTPMSIFLWLIFGSNKLLRVAAIAIGLSFSVEILQFVFWTSRSADIDDVILNVSGCVAGYALLTLIFKKYQRYT